MKISINKLLKKGKNAQPLNYCIVIPFANAHDMKSCLPMIQKIGLNVISRKLWCDGMIIDKEDYERLIKKSKSIEIVNELEDGNII